MRRRDAPRMQARMLASLAVLTLLAGVLVGRLGQLQLTDHPAGDARVAAPGTSRVPLPALRGRILDRDGRPVRYANSGCGVLDGGFTALEWDPSDPERPVSLVVWTHGDGEPRRVELHPDDDRVRAAR